MKDITTTIIEFLMEHPGMQVGDKISICVSSLSTKSGSINVAHTLTQEDMDSYKAAMHEVDMFLEELAVQETEDGRFGSRVHDE